MKKLAIVLGSILLASMSFAEETATTEVLDPSTIETQADKEEPKELNNTVGVEYRYFFDGEYNNIPANFGRYQINGKLELTEADTLTFRGRMFENYRSITDTYYGLEPKAGEGMLWYDHSHGKIGTSKVDLTSQFEFKQRADIDAGYQTYIQYGALFEFVEYFSSTPDWFKANSVALKPLYQQQWTDNPDIYTRRIGLDFQSSWSLPGGWGFDWAFRYFNTNDVGDPNTAFYTVYPVNTPEPSALVVLPNGTTIGQVNTGPKPVYVDYLVEYEIPGNRTNFNNFTVEAYLYRTWSMWESENKKTKLDFEFITGLDDLGIYQDQNGSSTGQNYYSYYADPDFKLTHQVNTNMSAYLIAGAEYRNFMITNIDGARQWAWRPYVAAGITAKF